MKNVNTSYRGPNRISIHYTQSAQFKICDKFNLRIVILRVLSPRIIRTSTIMKM